jgi:hypothetical protein
MPMNWYWPHGTSATSRATAVTSSRLRLRKCLPNTSGIVIASYCTPARQISGAMK